MTTLLTAEVLAVDLVHVVIICPVCGKFHQHGSNGSITAQNYGTRVPHCTEEEAFQFNGEYELVTTDYTIRKPKLQDRDIELWRYEQERRRAMIMRVRREQEAAEQDRRILEAIRELHAHGRKLARWRIALHAGVTPHAVTQWMHDKCIYYGGGRYRVLSISQAGPELSKIFGAPV